MSAIDEQVGGDHYKNLAIQPIEYITKNNLGYIEGNVIKYITRYKDKGGVEDLKKARHYIDLAIEKCGGEPIHTANEVDKLHRVIDAYISCDVCGFVKETHCVVPLPDLDDIKKCFKHTFGATNIKLCIHNKHVAHVLNWVSNTYPGWVYEKELLSYRGYVKIVFNKSNKSNNGYVGEHNDNPVYFIRYETCKNAILANESDHAVIHARGSIAQELITYLETELGSTYEISKGGVDPAGYTVIIAQKCITGPNPIIANNSGGVGRIGYVRSYTCTYPFNTIDDCFGIISQLNRNNRLSVAISPSQVYTFVKHFYEVYDDAYDMAQIPGLPGKTVFVLYPKGPKEDIAKEPCPTGYVMVPNETPIAFKGLPDLNNIICDQPPDADITMEVDPETTQYLVEKLRKLYGRENRIELQDCISNDRCVVVMTRRK